jgi:transcriptional regulator with XRE-family HTH domain
MQKTDLRKILADNVRAYRTHEKLSQDEFAHLCGLHRTYIGSVERCERNVTLATLELLADTMKFGVPALLTKGESK